MKRQIFKGIPIYDDQAFKTLEDLFNENRGQILAALPWLVSELIEQVSFKITLEFIYENGGRKLYIRNDWKDLADKFGFPVTEQLYNQIMHLSDSSGYLEIPSPWGVSERIRRALVVSSYNKGMSREEIRETFGVSSRSLTDLFRRKSRQRERLSL
ncbi:hypothetical protein O4H49_05935 [Kiloniella laminariae]|uniref:Mor transcription activator domain-containing protein n=1 Tax=Kiloniella laminariae TaxID=454162 RepID=A0ABT4LGT6_9PROT|nr:hypothetical protein [Kiloniella laminariae]MCZ4280307.1 hypothetical protein [Kiloniella laminariae]